jgi:hypothetical protein
MQENQDLGLGTQEVKATQPAATTVAPSIEPQAEKLLSQHEVNSLVGGAKQKGFEKGYAQALAEAQAKAQAQQPTQPAQPVTQPQALSDEDRIRQIAAQEFENHARALREKALQEQQEAHGQQIAKQLAAKVSIAAEKYPDFNDVVKEVDYVNNFPDILSLSNTVDNSGDVLYDLAKNPGKIATLRQYIRDLPANLVQKEILRMSESIKANQNALNATSAPSPLAPIKPSNTGTDNGKIKSAADYRKQFAGIG